MFPNAQPAAKAVSRLGGLPDFLFSHPIVAGFFSALMLPVFGGVTAWFFSLIAVPGPLELFAAVRVGAMLAMGFGAMIFIGIFISAFHEKDELVARVQYFFGGMVGLGLVITLDILFADDVRAFLIGA